MIFADNILKKYKRIDIVENNLYPTERAFAESRSSVWRVGFSCNRGRGFMVFHEFCAHASVIRVHCVCTCLCVCVCVGGDVENTGVVRSIRTSHGSIGACLTQVYTFVWGDSPQIVTVYKSYFSLKSYL